MKKKKIMVQLLVLTIILTIIGIINVLINVIDVPVNNMIDRQVDYITISTVFAGFSFTALGLLLGMSSEKLITKVKNTSIIPRKISKIIASIMFFIASVFVSLVYVLGLADIVQKIDKVGTAVYETLYIIGIGYLIIGIVYFVVSVFELSDLIKRVYDYNANENNKQISSAKEQLNKITDYKKEDDDTF